MVVERSNGTSEDRAMNTISQNGATMEPTASPSQPQSLHLPHGWCLWGTEVKVRLQLGRVFGSRTQ